MCLLLMSPLLESSCSRTLPKCELVMCWEELELTFDRWLDLEEKSHKLGTLTAPPWALSVDQTSKDKG